MPPVSEAQRKAMYAAKAGKSTLGIPKSIGAEFVKADPGGKLPNIKPNKASTRNYAKGGPVNKGE
jgi:hypothetical protein